MQRQQHYLLIILFAILLCTARAAGVEDHESINGNEQQTYHQAITEESTTTSRGGLRGSIVRKLEFRVNPRQGAGRHSRNFNDFKKKKGENFGSWADRKKKQHNEKARDKTWMKEQMDNINEKKADKEWIKEQMDIIKGAENVIKGNQNEKKKVKYSRKR